jgi:hypothetical protein
MRPKRSGAIIAKQSARVWPVLTLQKRMVSANEITEPMDHLPHPLPRPSQTTHHQPRLHRRPRPSALRLQGRLSGRIQRRRPQHCPPSDLRRCLRPSAGAPRVGRAATNFATARTIASTRNLSCFVAPASPNPQISTTLSRPPQSNRRPALSLTLGRAALQRRVKVPPGKGPLGPLIARGSYQGTTSVVPSYAANGTAALAAVSRKPAYAAPHNRPERNRVVARNRTAEAGHWSDHCPLLFSERPMNSYLWKINPPPRTKPVIAGDTTHGVSLLTATISGSNFAFP